jgi:hypothetical protein
MLQALIQPLPKIYHSYRSLLRVRLMMLVFQAHGFVGLEHKKGHHYNMLEVMM